MAILYHIHEIDEKLGLHSVKFVCVIYVYINFLFLHSFVLYYAYFFSHHYAPFLLFLQWFYCFIISVTIMFSFCFSFNGFKSYVISVTIMFSFYFLFIGFIACIFSVTIVLIFCFCFHWFYIMHIFSVTIMFLFCFSFNGFIISLFQSPLCSFSAFHSMVLYHALF